MTYDFRAASNFARIHGWRIKESYKPYRQWFMESSDRTILLSWTKPGVVDINEVTDDDETLEHIPEAHLERWIHDADPRLKLDEIEIALDEDQ